MTNKSTKTEKTKAVVPFIFAILVLAFSLLATSCGGSSIQLDDQLSQNSNSQPADDSSLNPIIATGGTYPAIPADDSGVADRSASAVEIVPGSDALMISNGVVDGTTLILGSSTEEMAWGLYRVSGLAGRKVDSLTIQALVGGPDQIYSVGVSNFSDGVWEFLETATLPEYEYDLTDEQARLVSSLGNLYFIVVVSGGDSVTVEQAAISSEVDASNGADLPPALAGRPQVSEGLSDRIVVTWAAVDGAQSYEVWRALDVDGMDEQFELLATLAELTYTDTAIQLETEYKYKIRGINAAGEGSFSRESSGWAGATAPEGEDVEGDHNETFGAIEAIDSMSIAVNGILFAISDDTSWLDDNNLPADPASFSVGMTVEIHGKADGNGGWIATRIEVEDHQEGQESEAKGTIDSISASEIVVGGLSYILTESTEWLDDNNNPLTAGDFMVGDMVEVESRVSSEGNMVALKVKQEIEDEGGNGELIDVDGLIEAISADSITVLGTTLSHDETTEWEDGDGNPLTWEDFMVGDAVKVDGTGDSESGWHATRVRLDV